MRKKCASVKSRRVREDGGRHIGNASVRNCRLCILMLLPGDGADEKRTHAECKVRVQLMWRFVDENDGLVEAAWRCLKSNSVAGRGQRGC